VHTQVRDIQRMTGALIKLPESQTAQVEEVTVEIFGNFMATQVRSYCVDLLCKLKF
jgi:undecaprenyl pyrophosphate synthase